MERGEWSGVWFNSPEFGIIKKKMWSLEKKENI
jgi:hypothetical protein